MFDLFLFHVFYVTVTLNSTVPCFFNYTAGADLWQNCGMGNDYLVTAMLPFQWVTGGWFSMIMVSVFVLMTYIKYQKVVYPMIIGTLFLPVSYFLFPTQFLSFAFLMAGCGIALIIGYVYISQTNET